MNLFDMNDPKKAELKQKLEEKHRRQQHPEEWNTCVICGGKIDPMFEGKIGDDTYCLDCYMQVRGGVQDESHD